MAPFAYPLPQTALVTFSSVFIDPSSSFTTALADATAARTRLHLALKTAADNPAAHATAVIEAAQAYLPFLRGIIACVESDQLLYRNDPVFQWRSPLTHYTVSSAPLLPLPSLQSEFLFVLLAYTLSLANYARNILDALPRLEAKAGQAHYSAEEEKRITAGLARVVDLLCQASGVASWVAENVIPVLEPIRATSGGRAGKSKWPIEAGAEAFRGLSMILLADAHVVAIRKLLLPVLSHSMFAPPGPPLPSNHPSPALLAKLYLHITSLYDSASALFKIHTDTPSSKKLFRMEKTDEPDTVEGEIIPSFKRYLRKESMISLALAHKWLGVDAGENGKGMKVGEAICWMKDSQSRTEALEDSAMREKMKGLGMGKANEKKKEERKARQGRVERELKDVGAWLKSYQRQNDTVAFQPIPMISTLTVPSGRPIFAAKAFVPPPSKFGDNLAGEADNEVTEKDANYAGKGTYY